MTPDKRIITECNVYVRPIYYTSILVKFCHLRFIQISLCLPVVVEENDTHVKYFASGALKTCNLGSKVRFIFLNYRIQSIRESHLNYLNERALLLSSINALEDLV